MATPSQSIVMDALALLMPSKQPATTSNSPALKDYQDTMERATVSKAPLTSDLRMLETGSLSDFTVICGKQEWKAHRFALSRCPYFKPIVSEDSAYKEAQESRITIKGFEPFEIGWLLKYIYSLQLDLEQAKTGSPNNSYLETCVITWNLGDYFWLPELRQKALGKLADRCKKLCIASRCISVVSKEVSFLSDLEAGIRAAWRDDRITGPSRKLLMTVATSLQPYLWDQPSFIGLLDELPEFTTDFVKALLGCPGMQIQTTNSTQSWCLECHELVYDRTRGEGKEFVEGAFVVLADSLEILAGSRMFYCSKACYNSGRPDKFRYTEDLLHEI